MLAVLLSLTAVLTVVALTAFPFHDHERGRVEPLLIVTGGIWTAATAATAVLLRGRRPASTRAIVAVVLAGSALLGGASLAGPPNTSTDSARYAWDGIVQRAGVSPYAYAPADPALRDLRPAWLFPPAARDAAGSGPSCTGERVFTTTDTGTDDVLCTTINRPQVLTIYPPVAEFLFAGVRLVVGPDAAYWPLQVVGLLLSLGTTLLLLRLLLARGLDPRWAALWGWSPLVLSEGITNSHIDLLGAVLALVATALVATRRSWWGGIALGAAIATKLIPALAAPALLRRHGWKVAVGAAAAFAVSYVPYVIASGPAVLGYLPGYLTEEGYDSGARFVLLGAVLPGLAATVAAGLLLVGTAVLVWRRSDAASPWFGQLVMIGVALLILTPRYSWYALLLMPFIVMTGRWEWAAIGAALTLRVFVPSPELLRLSLALALLLILVMSVRRAGGPRAVATAAGRVGAEVVRLVSRPLPRRLP